MSFRICFPNGLKRAFTLSYDDNQIYDRRLVDMFNRNGLKGTFHLNSGKLGQENEVDHFVSADEVKDLYKGHEVACHAVTHPYLSQLPDGLLMKEILDDRSNLENITGTIVRGMSYPYGDFSDRLISIASAVGIEYSRTVENTGYFNIPADFMKWHPTCHHNDAMKYVDDFLNGPHFRDMALFYVWGHSFEFDRENTWDYMEEFCKKMGGHDSVWYATNIEIKDYMTAARSLIMSADTSIIYNPTAIDVYVIKDEKVIKIPKGETIKVQ